MLDRPITCTNDKTHRQKLPYYNITKADLNFCLLTVMLKHFLNQLSRLYLRLFYIIDYMVVNA